MESKIELDIENLKVEKLSGNGQCVCADCSDRCWTDWFYRINGKVVCSDCLKKALEEEMILSHSNIESEKSTYCDMHLKVLEMQRKERQQIKRIIKEQAREIQICDIYREHFVKYRD